MKTCGECSVCKDIATVQFCQIYIDKCDIYDLYKNCMKTCKKCPEGKCCMQVYKKYILNLSRYNQPKMPIWPKARPPAFFGFFKSQSQQSETLEYSRALQITLEKLKTL